MSDTHIKLVEGRLSHEITFHEQNTGDRQAHKSIGVSRSLIGCDLWTATMWQINLTATYRKKKRTFIFLLISKKLLCKFKALP